MNISPDLDRAYSELIKTDQVLSKITQWENDIDPEVGTNNAEYQKDCEQFASCLNMLNRANESENEAEIVKALHHLRIAAFNTKQNLDLLIENIELRIA